MSLTPKDVAEVLKLLEESAFEELVLETDGLKIELRRGDRAGKPRPAPETPKSAPAKAEPAPSARKPAPAPAENKGASPAPDGMTDVPAPLLGVFYHAPKPGAEPFIQVGQKIDEDTIIGIIEVMKLMNSVRAGVSGEVVEIMAQNATLVEYGEPLIRVRPAE